ncbi:Ribosomal protein L30 [Mycena chlorophos]|uniref:Large ribosomal subunit protein uL30m n=1 Tax=Mycena chlorophos TaxID=658473 RepID=A0A8H6WCT2_MYCCL|nr:Ribosomal protein L30 [Mycena chlorophos]
MAAARVCFYSTSTLSPRLANLRVISTPPDTPPAPPPSKAEDEAAQATHFKITLRRSAISLGDKKKGTLAALGLYRRHQTVFHPHKPDIAGKILAVKELLEVTNVPSSQVRNKQEQRQDRKAPKGFEVVGTRMGGLKGV